MLFPDQSITRKGKCPEGSPGRSGTARRGEVRESLGVNCPGAEGVEEQGAGQTLECAVWEAGGGQVVGRVGNEAPGAGCWLSQAVAWEPPQSFGSDSTGKETATEQKRNWKIWKENEKGRETRPWRGWYMPSGVLAPLSDQRGP